jgi:hypothetical protein
MKRTFITCATVAAFASVTATPAAHARDGEIAAGVIGGLVLGAILSEAATPQRPYGPQYAPSPAYAAPQEVCIQQEKVWSPRSQAYLIRKTRVPCD